MVSPTAAALWGMLLLPIGLLNWRYAEPLARLEEQIDAIGSKRSWSSVEPADWKVLLTRYLGMGVTAVGALCIAYWLLAGVLG